MPAHNRPEQLERAARSVLDQHGIPVELIIVDDASTDTTPDVVARLAEEPAVTVLRNEVSTGPSGARNRGIEKANGDYLAFCDDDDEWLPGAAALLVGDLESKPDVGAVTSWHQVVHSERNTPVEYRGPTGFGANELLWFNFVALPFGVIRRNAFAGDIRFDTDLRGNEDWDLWLRCAQERPFGVMPRILYRYHQHGGVRVTGARDALAAGQQKFLDKHRHAMSAACVTYHVALIANLRSGRPAMLRALRVEALRDPAGAAAAAAVLSAGFAASALARRRHDPGLPARVMRRMVARPVPAAAAR